MSTRPMNGTNKGANLEGRAWLRSLIEAAIAFIILLWCGVALMLALSKADFRGTVLTFGLSLTVLCAILWAGDAVKAITLPPGLAKLLWAAMIGGMASTTLVAYRLFAAGDRLSDVTLATPLTLPSGSKLEALFIGSLPDNRLCRRLGEISAAIQARHLTADPVELFTDAAGMNGLDATTVKGFAAECVPKQGAPEKLASSCEGAKEAEFVVDCNWFTWLRRMKKDGIIDRRPIAILKAGTQVYGVAPGAEVAGVRVKYIVAVPRSDGLSPFSPAVLVAATADKAAGGRP